MFPILMVACFALFVVSMIMTCTELGSRSVAAQPAAGAGEETASPEQQAAVGEKVEQVINERIAQLDEKLVDLHTRTAAELKTAVDEAEERMRELEKDVGSKLSAAAEDASAMGGAAAPSTEDVPDLKHLMQERMEQRGGIRLFNEQIDIEINIDSFQINWKSIPRRIRLNCIFIRSVILIQLWFAIMVIFTFEPIIINSGRILDIDTVIRI